MASIRAMIGSGVRKRHLRDGKRAPNPPNRNDAATSKLSNGHKAVIHRMDRASSGYKPLCNGGVELKNLYPLVRLILVAQACEDVRFMLRRAVPMELRQFRRCSVRRSSQLIVPNSCAGLGATRIAVNWTSGCA